MISRLGGPLPLMYPPSIQPYPKTPKITAPVRLLKSNAQSHRIRAQIGGLGAEAYSCTLSTETVEMGP